MCPTLSSCDRGFSPLRPLSATRILPLLALLWLTSSANSAAARPVVDRRLERPAAQKGQSSASSYAQRTVSLTAAGSVEFEFFVDSEKGKDFLELFVDGVATFRASGRSRGGTA